MAILSKRKRVFLAVALAASLSNGFIIAPRVKVFPPETRRNLPVYVAGRNAAKPPLQMFWGKEDVATTIEKSSSDRANPLFQNIFSVNPFQFTTQEPKELAAGRFSLIAAKAETIIQPAADALDEATDGWALTYANLSPENQTTPVGQAFLASNLAYAAAGMGLSIQGDLFLGLLVEFASVASFVYHYTQLDEASKNNTVRLALFVDYVMAFTAIFAGLGYMLMDGTIPPIEGLVSAAVGMSFFLLGCTICAEGMAYVVVHSLWHVFSAYCAYIIGNTHLSHLSSM